jgi:hypothetical protein
MDGCEQTLLLGDSTPLGRQRISGCRVRRLLGGDRISGCRMRRLLGN